MSPSFAALATGALVGLACAGCTRRPVENLSMQQPVAISTNDVAIAQFTPMGRREFLVVAASGAHRTLVGQRFAYGGEVVTLEPAERMEWTEHAPAGAKLFVAESGRGLDELMQAWAGWTDATGLHLVHANDDGPPATIAVPEGDLVALPPVIAASGHLEAFVFHSLGGSASLLRHEATGAAKATPVVKTDTLLSVPAVPKLAASAAVSQVRGHDVAIVGWVLSDARACTVGVAVVKGSATTATGATVDIAGLRPVGGRLALQMTPMIPSFDETGRPPGVQVAFVAEQVERGGYAMVRADFDARSGQFHVQTTPLQLPPSSPLHSAYVWLARDPGDARVRVYALREDGVLMLWKDGTVRSRRAGVPLDYAFPIEPDEREPHVTAVGEIQLAPMRWDP